MAVLLAAAMLLSGCGIFPKEEELQTDPIVQAYQQDEFRMADVERGRLEHYENIDVTVQSIDQTNMSFNVDDMEYKGVYVAAGDHVVEGQALAEIDPAQKAHRLTSEQPTMLKAPYDGIVLYAKEVAQGERCVAGDLVVVVAKSTNYILSAYTVYWKSFEVGKSYNVTVGGEELPATVVTAEEIGLPAQPHPTEDNVPDRVYFKLETANSLLLAATKGNLRILIEAKDDVLYVPSSALTTVNDQEIVYMQDENGIRSVQYVKTGMDAGSYVEITDGLKEGDKVILE